jgi:quercetin dioxygenase-like cupin family protein
MTKRVQQPGEINFEGLKTSIPYNIVNLVDYNSESVSAVAILKEISGRVTAMAFDSGVGFEERTIAFDTFIHVIDGALTVVINKEAIDLKAGEGMIMPAHYSHAIKPGGKFKIIMTILKGGYEE